MKNVTLAIDDQLLQASRDYAQKHGTTLNALVRQLLEQQVKPPQKSPFQELFDLADKVKGRSTGPWTREELYER